MRRILFTPFWARPITTRRTMKARRGRPHKYADQAVGRTVCGRPNLPLLHGHGARVWRLPPQNACRRCAQAPDTRKETNA